MSFVSAKIDWNHWQDLWKDPDIQLQFVILLSLIILVFILTKISKPLVISISENSENNELKKLIWNNATRMVAPVYLLTSCFIAVAVVAKFSISADELIRPFTSAAGAWAIYRMISGFIKSRAWLRLVAVVAFCISCIT